MLTRLHGSLYALLLFAYDKECVSQKALSNILDPFVRPLALMFLWFIVCGFAVGVLSSLAMILLR